MQYVHVKKRKNPEKRLENWLKKHLELFEKGMKLVATQYRCYYQSEDYLYFNQIDILAEDKNKIPTLIEVKIRANPYTLKMQLAKYIKEFPTECRGIIAAINFPPSLLKTKLPSNIQLWRLKDKYKGHKKSNGLHQNKKLG